MQKQDSLSMVYLRKFFSRGALGWDQRRWIPARENYLFPVKALSSYEPSARPRQNGCSNWPDSISWNVHATNRDHLILPRLPKTSPPHRWFRCDPPHNSLYKSHRTW